MKITILRIEQVIITNEQQVLEKQEFTCWNDAFAYLEKQLQQTLSDDLRSEFKAHDFTTTNPMLEMVSDGKVAYSARVFYAVEVKA